MIQRLADDRPHVGVPRVDERTLWLAYNASDVTFRVLRAFGWGPMLNLGYYPFGQPFTLLNFLISTHWFPPFFRLPAAQLSLIKRAIALLPLHDGRRVLDVGCGRGMSSYLMANTFPHLDVSGVDLLADHVAIAQTLFSNTPNLQFIRGDAMNLDFPDRSFDRALCVEAAFQFPDRGRFLSELGRVVAPGGRAVIVDFMWENDDARVRCDADALQVVRATWQLRDFDSVGQYRRNAETNGFTIDACLDWSSHVTAPIITIFGIVGGLARRSWGRAFLRRFNPLLRPISDLDWAKFVQSARAHQRVHGCAKYMVLVLTR
ncbi:MAG TPA: methyltransferase domain-containing protein [Candidatus Binatia bacterium]|nr:methyltransferase domain-containing protein [Candidatus Binatia bacterium]